MMKEVPPGKISSPKLSRSKPPVRSEIRKKSLQFLISLFQQIEYCYPLTFLGSLTLVSLIYLLGLSFSNSNIYALLVSVPGLFFIVFVILFTQLWSLRQGKPDFLWDSNRDFIARKEDAELSIKLNASRPPYFFRYHFQYYAKLHAGRDSNFYYLQEASSSTDGDIRIPLYFPACGRLRITGKFLLKDMIGISRVRLGNRQQREFCILPPVFGKKPILPRLNSISSKDSQNRKISEEEKYHMREYIHGDRLKDINWKASLKIGNMITKISHHSKEKSQCLHIELRNISIEKKDTPHSILQLNVIKSNLLSFLMQINSQYPQYHFTVCTAEEIFNLKNKKEIENFGKALAKIQYTSSFSTHSSSKLLQEKFIFTTSMDFSLISSLSSQGKTREGIHIYQTVPAQSTESERIRLLALEEDTPLPGFWILRKSRSGYRKETPKIPLQVGYHPIKVRMSVI